MIKGSVPFIALFRGEIDSDSFHQSLQSYLGILSHVDGHGLATFLKNYFCFFAREV
jgi:hypothetical protein